MRYKRKVTVAFNGLPLTAKFHPYEFGAKDEIAILKEKEQLQDSTLLFVASLLSMQKWRYSYGRKCFMNKLKSFEIQVPVDKNNRIDEEAISQIITKKIKDYIPKTKPKPSTLIEIKKWKEFLLSDIFQIKNGEFHKTEGLDSGKIPLISCSDSNNGITGYYELNSEFIYSKALTVTFDGQPLIIKYHDYAFSAYDNVGVLLPKERLNTQTLIFIAGLISLQRWRYSYGRKCYQTKINNLTLRLPVKEDNLIDQKAIKEIVLSIPYSDTVLS